MKAVLPCFAVVLMVVTAIADEKAETIDSKKLVGTWKMEPLSGKGPPALIEFAADGKFTITIEGDGKKRTATGKYKLEGNKLVLTRDNADLVLKATILKLSDSEMVTEDNEEGTVRKQTLKRLEEKKKE